jgi:ABC-type sugar transport system ATPase subunit
VSVARLEAREITKRFSGVTAVDRANLVLQPGEIHALVGENGSGKSTLCMVFSGVYRPDHGTLWIDGLEVSPGSPREAQKFGVSMTYQESNLVPELTVAENIALGHEPFFSRSTGVDRRVRGVLERLRFRLDPHQKAARLSGAQMQMVEIAKALFTDSKIIIMDEPTAALSGAETETLHSVVRELAAQGLSVIYISHALEEALTLAHKVSVLRDGRIVACQPSSELDRATLVRLMVGRHVEIVSRPKTSAAPGEELLRADELSWGQRVRNVSLSLRTGEVVGLAGLVGSGRSELANLLGGAEQPTAGRLIVQGRQTRLRSPAAARRLGIAYLTENRKEDGLFLQLSVARNITISVIHRLAAFLGIISTQRENAEASRLIQGFGIVAPSLKAEVRTLSGGNQQKLLFARLMNWSPKILILDEPTKGVDVGAIAEIHHLIRASAASGKAVLVISSYLPEIMALADRVLVMRQGAIVTEVNAREATSDRIISQAFR